MSQEDLIKAALTGLIFYLVVGFLPADAGNWQNAVVGGLAAAAAIVTVEIYKRLTRSR